VGTRSVLVVVIASLSLSAHADIIQAGVQPGEAFTYRFSVGPIEGARARMSIGEPVVRDGHSLLAVQGEAETISLVNLVAPVNANYKLIVDASTLLPQEVTTVERGMHERSFHSTLVGRTIDLEVIAANRNLKAKRVLPREVRDPLSAFFALRASRLADGNKLELDVQDDGKGISDDAAKSPSSLGLLGLKERARRLGGDVGVKSKKPHGTRVRLAVPIVESDEEQP